MQSPKRDAILYSTAAVSEAAFANFLKTIKPQIWKLSPDKTFEGREDVHHLYCNGGRSNLYLLFHMLADELEKPQGYLTEAIAEKDAFLVALKKQIAQVLPVLKAKPKTMVWATFSGETDGESQESQQMMLELIREFSERFPLCATLL
jgi:hypothetical protein